MSGLAHTVKFNAINNIRDSPGGKTTQLKIQKYAIAYFTANDA